VTPTSGAPADPQAAPADSNAVTKAAAQLLRQTLRAATRLHHTDPTTSPAADRECIDLAHSAMNAWSAYRALTALRTADPDLAAATVGDLNAELDTLSLYELAFNAAVAEGHDPTPWINEFTAAHTNTPEQRNPLPAAHQPAAPRELPGTASAAPLTHTAINPTGSPHVVPRTAHP
jgi:hypothetical protein